MDLGKEFTRQQNVLVEKGYPEVAGMTTEVFLKYIEPLRNALGGLTVSDVDTEQGYIPFVIVVPSELVPTEKAMSLVEKDGKKGITKLYPHTPDDFQVIDGIHIPPTDAYLLVDIDRGKATLNVRPNEAMETIRKENRSPLTIDEGVAIVTHFPEFLVKNNCFSLLASRHTGDKRVPALWINGTKNPNLGWCWDGNPHTWLGSASCKARIGS